MQLFLTSSVDDVAYDIAKKIGDTSKLKLVFITTAAEGEDGDKSWVNSDRQSLINAGFKQVVDYTFTNKNAQEVAIDLNRFDIIHLNGGNTAYLLKVMHKIGVFKVIRDLVLKQSKIYIGSSAGSMVAGSSIKELEKLDGNKNSAGELKCLNFVPFAIAPHWGSEYFKNEYQALWHRYYTEKTPFIMLPNDSYLWVRDTTMQIIAVKNNQ